MSTFYGDVMTLEEWWDARLRPTLQEWWVRLIGRAEDFAESVRRDPETWVKRAALVSAAVGAMTVSVRREARVAPRAFISFEMEDKWAREFLVQHARDRRTDIEFADYSVQDPFDTSWKTQCKARIGRTKGTIVLIGPTTSRSDAVLWEIAETTRQNHYLFGIQIHRDSTHRIPSGLPSENVIRWDFDKIAKWLGTWT